jgi:hypothetical protein
VTRTQLVQIGVAPVRALMKRSEERVSFQQRFAEASSHARSGRAEVIGAAMRNAPAARADHGLNRQAVGVDE